MMKRPTLKTYRRAFQIFIAVAFIIIPILNRSRYSYVYGNFLAFHAFGIPFADPLAILQLSIKNLYLTLDNIIGALLPLLLAFFLGTVFCSWICPFGLLSELTQAIRKKTVGRKTGEGTMTARGFPLKMTIFAVGFTGFFIFSTTPILNQLSMPAWYARFFQYYFGQDFISFSFLFILGTLAVEFMVGRRLWCRYICPQSILITLVKQLNPKRMKVVFTADKCICKPGYERCERACSLNLHPKTLYERAELECSNCGDCVVACTKMGRALSLVLPWNTRLWNRRRPVIDRRRMVVGFTLIVLVSALGTAGYLVSTHWHPKAASPAKTNVLLADKILAWDGARADYYELLAEGTLICVGGDWPTNGFKGGKWEAVAGGASFKMVFDRNNPATYTLVQIKEHPTPGVKCMLTRFADNASVADKPESHVLTRYEPIKQSHLQTATTMNATAVLNRYADDIYVLDLRVQDPEEVIKKIPTEGDAITNEGMLTSVKYWLNTPQIIVSEGSAPKLPIHTKMQIIFRDGHKEPAVFLTNRIVDKSNEEFEDPWF